MKRSIIIFDTSAVGTRGHTFPSSLVNRDFSVTRYNVCENKYYTTLRDIHPSENSREKLSRIESSNSASVETVKQGSNFSMYSDSQFRSKRSVAVRQNETKRNETKAEAKKDEAISREKSSNCRRIVVQRAISVGQGRRKKEKGNQRSCC